MRKFWLENSHGKIWDLTSNRTWDKNSAFLADPNGLGVKTKISSYEVENTIFVEDITTQAQSITGTIYFSDYDHFSRFVEFVGNINTQEPMKLYYSIDGISHGNSMDKQWYKRVLITELKKGEIDTKTSSLKISISFECISKWRKDKEITMSMSNNGEPLSYPYIYPFLYEGINHLAVEINNSGNLPTSCIVRIDGLTKKPTFRILQNGKVVDQARYDLTINENETLVVNSSPENQEASLYSTNEMGEVAQDVYHLGEKNYTFSNFITIPTGISVFIISGLDGVLGQVTLSYSEQRELI